MLAFESILVMLAVAVLVIAIAKRLRVPYPVLLALVGALVALLQIDVGIKLDPDLVLALFVAPVLLDAAYDASLRDLRRNLGAVLSLALIAVGLTTAAVALVVHWLVPSIPWAAAIAIGAIVAPTDAVAAVTVLRAVNLPHRVGVILEGEALLNDAATLIIYRLAVSAVAAGGTIGAEAIAPAFLLSVVGSLIAGPVLALIMRRLVNRIADAPSSIIMQFVTTFGIWLISEKVGLSPVLTVVSYGIMLGQSETYRQPARLRLPSFAVWETVVVVLNVLAFLLIGLELGPVIVAAPLNDLGRWAFIAGAVLVTVISVRLIWTIGAAGWSKLRIKRLGAEPPPDGLLPDWRTGLVVGWAGTRGIVTIGTALGLPQDFPDRGLLLFTAFAVTIGTLVIQGLTLRPLVVVLDLKDDEPVDREIREARVATAEAALAVVEADGDVEGLQTLKAEMLAERDIACEAEDGDGRPTLPLRQIQEKTLAARRRKLFEMRRSGAIGNDAFQRLEEELDVAELAVSTRT